MRNSNTKRRKDYMVTTSGQKEHLGVLKTHYKQKSNREQSYQDFRPITRHGCKGVNSFFDNLTVTRNKYCSYSQVLVYNVLCDCTYLKPITYFWHKAQRQSIMVMLLWEV